MSTAPLDLKIAVIGTNKLDNLVKRMDALENEVARLNKTLPRVSNNIRKVGTSSSTAARQTSTFSKAVGGLATAFASFQVGAGFAEAVRDARALELSGRRLNLLVNEYSQFNGVQKEAERLAKKFQVSVADSSKALFSLGSRLGAQGTTLDEIVSVYEGLNSALIVTGRSAQEAASANYQLSQALGSGKLTGDELRTIVETLPELLNEIAKQAGKTAAEIRQMAKDGELTTDVIIKATKALGEKYAAAVKDSITINQKFNNSIQGVSESIGKSLLPVLNPTQLLLIEFFNGVAALPAPLIAVGTAAVAAGLGIASLQLALSLLGLPGVIALLGKLAAALAGLAGVTATTVTGFTVAGAAIKSTTVVITAQTVALGALKLAFLAIPFGAIAAGIFVIIKAFAEGIEKAEKWAAVLRDSGAKEFQSVIVSLNLEKRKLLKTIDELRKSPWYRGQVGDIKEVQKEVDILNEKIDIATRRRRLIIELETVLSPYGVDIASLRAGAYGPGGAAPVVEPKDVVTNTDTDTGGAAASAPRASNAPQLERDVALAKELFALNNELVTAELERNEALIRGIQIKQFAVETQKEIADINASDLYDDEKKLTIEKAMIGLSEKLLGIEKEQRTAARDKAEAIAEAQRNALQPLEAQRQLLEATLNGRGEEERILMEIERIRKAAPGIEAGVVEELVRGNAERMKELERLEEIEAFYEAIGNRIKDGIVDGIMAAVDGTKELSEILSDVLRDIGKMLITRAIGMIPLPGFAEGGRPEPGRVSVVGEKGPELFVSDGPGTVLTNDQAFAAARGAMSRGSGSNSSDAFADNADAISVTNSYTKEKLMERERIASLNNNPIDVRAETTVINNIEYVTAQQFAQGMKSTARDAQAKVLNDLRNRPATRAKAGIR